MSIYSALSLALVGSAGKSRSEMLEALKLDIEGQDFDVLIRSVGEGLQKVPEGDVKNTLVQANAMFVDSSMAVLPAFSESLKSHFKSMAQEVRFSHRLSIFAFKADFIHAVEEARKTINSWVEANTARKIKDLFPVESLDATTRMVLANAIYFKGETVYGLVFESCPFRDVDGTI